MGCRFSDTFIVRDQINVKVEVGRSPHALSERCDLRYGDHSLELAVSLHLVL